MKAINKLFTRLNKQEDFEDKYPIYNESDNKIHILYVAPVLNGTGFYRMLLPALELNRTSAHSAIVTHLHKWDFNKLFDDYDSPTHENLIQWADYIILPAMLTDSSYIIKSTKQVNPDLIFVMDIDYNYYEIPKEHPNYAKVTSENKSTLLKNLSMMHIITVACEGLLDYYERLIGTNYQDSGTYLEFTPNLISSIGFEEIGSIQKNASEKVRIGMIGNSSSIKDILSIKDVLSEITKKYKEKVELILFGWNGLLPDGTNALEGIPFTFEKSVSFSQYYETLNNLLLDIALLPVQDIPFNTEGKSFIKFTELSAFSVPTIASNLEPYKKVIKHEDTGYLVDNKDQWLNTIDLLVNDKTKRQDVGKRAFKLAWQYLSFNNRTIRIFQKLYE